MATLRTEHEFLRSDGSGGFIFPVDENDEYAGISEHTKNMFKLCKSGRIRPRHRGAVLIDFGVKIKSVPA